MVVVVVVVVVGWWCVCALGLALTCDWLEASSVEVDLRGLGRVRGLQNPQFRVFRGIPYAQPPLAENRWNAPIPVAAWAPRVLDASQFGPGDPSRWNLTCCWGGLPGLAVPLVRRAAAWRGGACRIRGRFAR